jgi:phospholipid/cholesterol/gamma-HCH transport system permease protein
MFPLTRWFFRFFYSKTTIIISTLSLCFYYALLCGKAFFRGRIDWITLLRESHRIGVGTLPMALIMNTFTGMVISLQLSQEMARQGAASYIGALVSMALIRELAPIMAAFSVTAMACSANAAELSTMKITRQIDALEMMHISPVRYLMLPRVLATLLTLPCITLITCISGIVGGLLVSCFLANIHPDIFIESVKQQTTPYDIWVSLLKAVVFGFWISILSCSIGFSTQGGAKDVGFSTTRSVVWCFMAMTILDYGMTYAFYGSNR